MDLLHIFRPLLGTLDFFFLSMCGMDIVDFRVFNEEVIDRNHCCWKGICEMTGHINRALAKLNIILPGHRQQRGELKMLYSDAPIDSRSGLREKIGTGIQFDPTSVREL